MLIVYKESDGSVESISALEPEGGIITDEEVVHIDEITIQLSIGQKEYKVYDASLIKSVLKSSRHRAYIELVFDSSNEPIGVNYYEPISVTTDKPEILADGTDTATITATVDDTTSTETIELYNGDTLVDSKPAASGVATFEITMTQPGELTLTVRSTTKYGQADVTITGVDPIA